MIRFASVIALTAALAACGGRSDLAPVEYIGGGSTPHSSRGTVDSGEMPPVEAAPVAPVSRGGGITATPLEPVAGGAAPAAPSYQAVPAETAVAAPVATTADVAGVRYHTVVAGDTVYNISKRYGIDQAALMTANGIAPPYTVKLGQRLVIPAPAGAVAAPATTPVPVETVPASVEPPAAPAEEGTPPIEIIEPDPDSLPPPKPAPGTGGEAAPAAATGAALAATAVPTPGRKPTPPAPVAAPAAPAAAASVPAASGAATGSAPAAGSLRFLWPVAGDVISEFGSKPGGQHNDGINIQAAQGASVRAAEAGVVAYAGNEIRGFGNLVLIRHQDGWMTAYAHNATLLVKQGDKVARGQQIAKVGRSGNVTVPQLHFEVRKGRTPVDPLKYLDNGAG